jgi:hypothetical protein
MLPLCAQADIRSPPPPTADDGLQCFATLNAPEYPEAALKAHVDGSVWTWTEVGADGSIGKIDTQVVSEYGDAAGMLTAPAEAALKAAKIKPECNGKKVRVVFRYEFYGMAMPKPDITSEKDGPYLLTIESDPNEKH